jgi:protein PhnA
MVCSSRMKLKRWPELLSFLSTHLADTDAELDAQTVRDFASSAPASKRETLAAQARQLLAEADVPVDELGTEANRWFADPGEARAWLEIVIGSLGGDGTAGDPVQAATVKDSNGTPLAEGDTVQVIKDLKVKGGSSDLKRGTIIRKVHLTGDPEAIECRVDGSTLVLKTCFLKKA